MSSIITIGIICLISGILQILIPETLFKLNFFGIRSPEAIKRGGYLALFISICLLAISFIILLR